MKCNREPQTDWEKVVPKMCQCGHDRVWHYFPTSGFNAGCTFHSYGEDDYCGCEGFREREHQSGHPLESPGGKAKEE